MKEAEAIYNFWNSLNEHKNWRKHRVFTPGMYKAVKQWLKEGYTPSYLCDAIQNYYDARTTSGSWWHDICRKKWDFETFFSGGSRKEVYNWKRFEPERFELDEILTDVEKRRRIEQARAAQKEADKKAEYLNGYKDWIMNTDTETLLKQTDPYMIYAIKQLRPEITKEKKK